MINFINDFFVYQLILTKVNILFQMEVAIVTKNRSL